MFSPTQPALSINVFLCINYCHAWLEARWRDEKSFKVFFFLLLISSLLSISSQPVSSISSIFIVCSSLLHSLKYGIKVARGPGVTNKRWPNSVVNVGRGWRFFFCTREKLFSFSQIIETLNLVVRRLKLPPVTGTESQFEDAINRGALCFESRCWLDSYTKCCVFAVECCVVERELQTREKWKRRSNKSFSLQSSASADGWNCAEKYIKAAAAVQHVGGKVPRVARHLVNYLESLLALKSWT